MNINKVRKNLLAHLHLLPELVQVDVEFLLEKFDATACELEEIKRNVASWNKVENLPHEIWRDVAGYEGIYQVSNMGRVKSLHWLGGRLIKPSSNKKGYLSVGLSKNNVMKNNKVHVLVARAFLLNPENKPIVHHRDGNRKNNRLENLEWATHIENQQYSIQMGTKKYLSGHENPNAKLTPEQVRYIRKHYIKGHPEFNANALAIKFNVGQTTIYSVIHYKTYKNVE